MSEHRLIRHANNTQDRVAVLDGDADEPKTRQLNC